MSMNDFSDKLNFDMSVLDSFLFNTTFCRFDLTRLNVA
jgi:hypothetical protein